ncbi:hypothetical protein ACFQER_16060 [Halomicroarcula sp. GCM10025894]|uniref:hypothetical protein n=1 Tax=Halomicroarcula sp. GCM10025894 TaxID=3252673 RepID=UPI003607E075
MLIGASVLAYFQGAVDVLLSLADIPIMFLSFLGNYYGDLIAVVYGALPSIIQASWTGAIGFVTSAGPFGYFVAIAIVLATTYSIAQVVSRVR